MGMGTSRGVRTINLHRYVLSSFLLFMGTAWLQGQVRDFQTWWELELNRALTSRLQLEGEFEQRFRNNSLQYKSTLLTLGTSYDLLDMLSLSGGARSVFVVDGEQQMHTRFRLHLDATGSYDLAGFRFSLRSRLQYGFEEFVFLRQFRMNSLVNRNRLRLSYHIFGSRFDCFASAEGFHGPNNESQWLSYAIRYSAGAMYSKGFRSRFSLRYILENEYNVSNPQQLHVLVLGYTYQF